MTEQTMTLEEAKRLLDELADAIARLLASYYQKQHPQPDESAAT